MKILLVRLSSLGDLVYVTPLLEALHRGGHEVHLLTDRVYADLFVHDPRIHRLWLIDRQKIRHSVPPVLEALRQEGLDLALDLHKKPLTQFLVWRVNARRVLSIKKRSFSRRLRVWFRVSMPLWHISTWYAEPLVRAGVLSWPLPLPRLIPPSIVDLPVGLPSRYILLAPEASHPAKEWPFFRKLAQQLQESGTFPIIVVGTRSDPPRYPDNDLRGQTDLRTLVALIRNAEVVITNDSGPAHLAAATQRPLIVIYGPTVPEMGFRPLGSPCLRILQYPYGCRPCSLHGTRLCRFSHPSRCLTAILPTAVLQTLRSMPCFTIRDLNQERRRGKS